MINIILCGGQGSRLWPISREDHPKQFLKIFDHKSLFQKTIERNESLTNEFCIVTNEKHVNLMQEQFSELNLNSSYTMLVESIGRNTAPAIALACMQISAEKIVLVTPSDHLIINEEAYADAVVEAVKMAEENKLVTFGINPTMPETGFGYIQSEGEKAVGFHEKPDLKTAIRFLEAGNYLWNSGMFCFKVEVYLQELAQHAPEIYNACLDALKCLSAGQSLIPHGKMMQIPNESIDYAVMEKSNRVAVVHCDIGWSDLGSFDSIYDSFIKDYNGIVSNTVTVPVNSKNNYIYSENKKIIGLIDIEDLIIVETKDAILISKRNRSQDVKKIVQRLESSLLEKN